MTTKLTIEQFQKMIAAANKTIVERCGEFSRLDAALGDGDHGEAMTTAFAVIEKSSHKGGDFTSLLNDMGFAVMLETSGSTSTLLGAFLLGMSEGAPLAKEVTTAELRAIFAAGLAGVEKNTRARVGDKTMMDAIIPAIGAMQKSDTEDVATLFRLASTAALAGAASTVDMKANFGRGRNLGDKSIGHVDAGATSWASMFSSFASALEE